MSLAVVQFWNSNCVESLSGNRILSFKASFFFFFAWLGSPVYDAQTIMHFLLLRSDSFQFTLATSSSGRRESVCHPFIIWIISNPTLGWPSVVAKEVIVTQNHSILNTPKKLTPICLPLGSTDTRNHNIYFLLLGACWQNNIMTETMVPEIRPGFDLSLATHWLCDFEDTTLWSLIFHW